MHKVILFRGGMCGDVVLAMLDKAYVRSIYPMLLDRKRYVMKKFYNFSVKEKQEYFERMTGHTITHDTEFCRSLPSESVVQIYCSNEEILEKLAERFWTKNPANSVAHVKADLGLNENYALTDDFKAWQDFHVFSNRLDIAGIYDNDFPEYLHRVMGVNDIAWARTMHDIWPG